MSLHPKSIPAVPEATAEVAQAAFPRGNRYMQMRDECGTFFTDEDFSDLYATRGQPGESPWRLALVQIFAYMEDLSDEQAANAVRSRIDWKYALSLKLSDSGFNAAVLSEFRTRLVTGGAEVRLFEKLLDQFGTDGYIKARGRQRTDATHVLASVRAINRLVLVAETMRQALNVLATSAPDWLHPHIQAGWLAQYEKRADEYHFPKAKAKREALASQIGADGRTLLQAVAAEGSPSWLRELPAVRLLHRIWLEQYQAVAADQPMCWRETTELPPAGQRVHSPYDPEARYGSKRGMGWLGYKAHFTETCDEETPHLVVNVLTTPATETDFEAAAPIQDALAAKKLLPAEHLMDAGYVDSGLLVESQQQHQVTVIGPVAPDSSWQALSPDAYDSARFQIDWETHSVTCPQGHQSRKWSATQDKHENPIINIRFAPEDCLACPARALCTRAQAQPRNLTIRPQAQYDALQQRRQAQTTPEFQQAYNPRAGVEGTLSQAVRNTDLRRSRYVGLAKTALHNLLSAAALNLYRITDWLAQRPRALTRTTAFARLASLHT